ncbi:MAG: sigma-54-dependent Fis family transcriptional regulator [Deltaproteobacteria bacterium]|nr:sigma-54-dependent Fis family transcriptional regulator [Deltaproteobacteria bacterium]
MDSTLLITGSTGTGKSHLAQAVHRASPKRGAGRWHKVNLATLSDNLIESELFGHERGAFTGADCRRVGRLETCNDGTVFLDEIGELSLRLQAKLLDFIQYKKISPVGSNREIELDVRIIAATNRNLEAAVKAGEFRADLFHRLNVFHVRLPDLSLNSRAVSQFARDFLVERATATGKKITGVSKDVDQLFRHYPWPGNIRELENIIEFAAAMESGEVIRLQALPGHIQDYARDNLKLCTEGADTAEEPPEAGPVTSDTVRVSTPYATSAVGFLELPMTMSFHESKEVFEKAFIEQALRLCSGQINLTSRRIGLNKVSLSDKIRRFGIDWRKIRYDSLGPNLSTAT